MKRHYLLAFLLIVAAQVCAATVAMRVDGNRVEITGGAGAGAWKLAYGSMSGFSPQLLEASPERAFFAQGGWVRLIDTTRGIVIGRWHVGPTIVRMKPAGEEEVEVEVLDRARDRSISNSHDALVLHDSMIIGPSSKPRLLPTENSSLYASGQKEAAGLVSPFLPGSPPRFTADKARELLPVIEETARRDRFSPWFHVIRAYLMEQANDPGALAAFSEILQSSGGDFTDWLPISAYLFDARMSDIAKAAYERGYKDFLQRGYDPRLIDSKLFRMSLFPSAAAARVDVTAIPPEQAERLYQVSPQAEYAWISWQQFADHLQQQGHTQQAQLWRTRAHDARQNGPALLERFAQRFDLLALALLAFVPALLIFIAVVNLGCAAQRHADIEAGRRKWAIPLVSNLSYWTRSQRLALLFLALVGWAALGIGGIYAAGFIRAFTRPASLNGTYTGPIVRGHFQSLPASPERDLLLAMSYQQSGDSRRAEDLYRKLPQFAASWNNLGVLLKRRGRDDGATDAFRRALRIDPQLHEAAFNLDGATPDLWTQLHKQYVPERLMPAIAPPQVVQAAYRGGSSASSCFWSALRGPFWPANAYLVTVPDVPSARAESLMRMFSQLVGTGSLFLALILLFSRRRTVSEGAGPRQWIAELAFPGTSPAWYVLGGVVLTTWLACWLAIALFLVRHSPWLVTASMMRSNAGVGSGLAALNPSWGWFAVAIALLFAINAAIVLRKRKASQNPTASAAGAK